MKVHSSFPRDRLPLQPEAVVPALQRGLNCGEATLFGRGCFVLLEKIGQ